MTIHKLDPDPQDYAYVFGGREPLLTIRPGDLIEVRTEDCYGGRITSTADHL